MGSSSLVQPTPGDPREPDSGEPTIMAFRRPADRPQSSGGSKAQSGKPLSFAAADALPVVLRLPVITRGQSAPPPAAPVGAARPWIGIAMWCATGALAVVAAVLICTGKPDQPTPNDEAPQWRADSPDTGGASHVKGVGAAATPSNSDPPATGPTGAPAAGATGPLAAEGSNAAQSSTFPWRGGELSRQSAADGSAPSDGTPRGAAPPSDLPPSMAPGGTIPGDNAPGSAAPGSILPGNTPPAGGLGQPTVSPSGPPTGLSDPWPPPDQSKLQTNGPRTAAQPNGPGGARFDGSIRTPALRPTR